MKRMKHALFFVWCLMLLIPFSAAAQQGKTYTVSVVPQVRAAVVYERWSPFVRMLSKELGVKLKIKTYASIPDFEEALMRGEPDFAFMNPYHLVMTQKKARYIPLVRNNKSLVGILVAKKNGPVQSARDLDGKKIAFPAPNAFAASLYMRALLKEKEKINFTPSYVKTHSNVYRHVKLGTADAGGGVNRTLNKQPRGVKNALAIIYRTPGSAPHPFAAHKRVPKSLRKSMTRAILELASDPANKKMMGNVQLPRPKKANYRKDYLPLKKLGLEKYVK